MSNFFNFFLSTFVFSTVYFCIGISGAAAANFQNPVVKDLSSGCIGSNLRSERFSAEIGANEQVKLCRAMDKITTKLNLTSWSPALSDELKNIWQVFSVEPVTLRSMPKDYSSQMLAMAEPFPSKIVGGNFEACVYLRPEKSDDNSFFQVMLHELRHVYDFYETWKDKTALNVIESERRAFLLMGKITRETPEKEHFRNLPSFWKESWRKTSNDEIFTRQNAAVEKYLHHNKIYREADRNKQSFDFTFLSKTIKPANEWKVFSGNFKRDRDRLPDRPLLPATNFILPQNIRNADFNLEKPKNQRDEKEVLRVALSNEKKLYYGMSNFVYDRKLQFQCWQKGKVLSTLSQNTGIARTDNGDALIQSNLSLNQAAPSCVTNYQDLETDFTETFWASPALEKMPISFAGFVQIDGKTLARYTVLQPDQRLFSQLAAQYHSIKCFRVFVGTIFVSPEDGQIVKFWGTSYPEDNITGKNSQKVWGGYSVTALRQKLNINGGVWVTVYIGTVAVANLEKNPHPFSYTVNLNNYRQSTTEVKILDDEETVSIAGK